LARLIYILIAVFLANTIVKAQETNPKTLESIPASVGETLFIHASSTTLLTGETLQYKIYCLDPENKMPSVASKIAYVELIGNDLKSISGQKLYLENGTAQGDFFMPVSLKSGNYKLIGYTKHMMNVSSINYFTVDISVINPFQPFEGKTDSLQSEMEKTNHSTGSFSLTTNKKIYSVREKIDLKINASGKLPSGNYSVSVRKFDHLLISSNVHANEFRPAFSKAQEKTATELTELRGEIVSGKISSKRNGQSVHDKFIALSMPGTSFVFKIVQTGRDGRFYFLLDKTPDNAETVIQVMEPDRDNYVIILDEDINPDLSALSFSTLSLNPEMKEEIQQRSIASQIENAYYDRKKDSIFASAATEPFFHPLEKVYTLDDYTRFPTLKETIIEVLKEIYFTRENDHNVIHVRNITMDNEMYGLPLVLVDGLLIQDVDELFEYGMRYVQKVSLINEPYIYGPKTFGGIVNFTTKLNDYKSKSKGDFIKKIVFERPIAAKTYFQPDYSMTTNSKIPDYRYQLLWMPKINDANETISFYSSDVTGKFEITLEGFTDKGIPVSVTDFIEVR
jgi:hypothetical protein